MTLSLKNKKIFSTLILLVFIFVLIIPIGALAQTGSPPARDYGKFIPCDGVTVPCDFAALMKLVQNVLNWIVLISFPASIIAISWAGFTFLTTGIADKRSEARAMLFKVVIGFAVILAAWLIVRTIVETILAPGYGTQFINL